MADAPVHQILSYSVVRAPLPLLVPPRAQARGRASQAAHAAGELLSQRKISCAVHTRVR